METGLRVSRGADVSCLGDGVSRQVRTRGERSEKRVVLRSGCRTERGVIAAFFCPWAPCVYWPRMHGFSPDFMR